MDADSALDVDVIAEASGKHQLLDLAVLDAHDLLEHQDPGVDRALGKLELPNVLLADGDILTMAGLRGPGEDELPLALSLDEAVAQRRRQPVALVNP